MVTVRVGHYCFGAIFYGKVEQNNIINNQVAHCSSSRIHSALYYASHSEQGAAIFRSIAGGHMFLNGNKRTAVFAWTRFASANGLPVKGFDDLMNVATNTANGVFSDLPSIVNALIK